MKKRILALINHTGGFNITELPQRLPETKGSKKMCLPQADKVMLTAGVNEEAIRAIYSLLAKRKIQLAFVDPWVFVAEKSPCYHPVAQMQDIEQNKASWFPCRVIPN